MRGGRYAPPTTSAGTPIINPSKVPAGTYLYVTGAFDLDKHDGQKTVSEINNDTHDIGAVYEVTDSGTLTLGDLAVSPGDIVQYYWGVWSKVTIGTRGIGRQFAIEQTGQGFSFVEGRFIEHVYVLGGLISEAEGADSWDWISMSLSFPASTPEDRTATNDGNATKVSVGPGVNIIIPATNGDWNVDGADFEIGEINRNLCPVPNATGQGYWNWDPELAPAATITPVSDPGNPDGAYDLFDFSLGTKLRQANRLPVRYEGPITPDALKGKKLLPHWLVRFTVSRSRIPGSVSASAIMHLARKVTV